MQYFLTLQWVVLTGRPILDATTTVIAEASSMLNPLKKERICYFTATAQRSVSYECEYVSYLDGVMGVRSLPMVLITLRPSTQSPAQMPTPPNRSSQMGVGKLDTTDPLSYSSQMATRGPIALLEEKKAPLKS